MKNYTNYTFFYNGSFSQWNSSNFRLLGLEFNCAEQYMMYKKALLFNDEETARQIMSAKHPREQKALGRLVKNFDENVWNENARDFVLEGNFAKFTQNPGHLSALFETKDTLLVEASPTDRIWGIGLAMDSPDLLHKDRWRGTNWLGEVLTSLRDNLLEGEFIPGSALSMGFYSWSESDGDREDD